MSLTLTILGCASSGGVPRAGGIGQEGRWGACDPDEPRNTRQRCALLVRRTMPEGETVCVIDTGPDFRQQMLAANVERLDAAVYTHEHADHLHGIDDLRPYALSSRARIPVYMDDATYARARIGFGYCFETPPGSSYPPILDRQRIEHTRTFSISGAGGPIHLTPIPVEHGDMRALGFRIANAVYLPDVSAVPSDQMHHFSGLDVLIIDALRIRPHVSHFSLSDALSFRENVQPAHTILTNMHIDLDYASVNAQTPETVEPAYDGLTITL